MNSQRKPALRAVRSEDAAAYAVDTTTPQDDAAIIARATEILHAQAQRGPTFGDPAAAGLYMSARLHGLEREIFAAAFLDSRHRLIEYRELFAGTVDGTEVHPRELVKAALECNACAVIIAHNHPSGDPTPSAADRAVTARLKQALALVDVRLLDHFVVGDGPAVSMAARGLV